MVHLENLDVRVDQEDQDAQVQQGHQVSREYLDHLALSVREVLRVYKASQGTKVYLVKEVFAGQLFGTHTNGFFSLTWSAIKISFI